MSGAANNNALAVTVIRQRDRRRTRHPFRAILPRGMGSCGCASIGDAVETGAHWHANIFHLPPTVAVKVVVEACQ